MCRVGGELRLLPIPGDNAGLTNEGVLESRVPRHEVVGIVEAEHDVLNVARRLLRLQFAGGVGGRVFVRDSLIFYDAVRARQNAEEVGQHAEHGVADVARRRVRAVLLGVVFVDVGEPALVVVGGPRAEDRDFLLNVVGAVLGEQRDEAMKLGFGEPLLLFDGQVAGRVLLCRRLENFLRLDVELLPSCHCIGFLGPSWGSYAVLELSSSLSSAQAADGAAATESREGAPSSRSECARARAGRAPASSPAAPRRSSEALPKETG